MSGTLIIILIIIGILLIAVEALLLPGSFIAGVSGIIMLILAIGASFYTFGAIMGSIALFGSIAAAGIIIMVGIKGLQNSKFTVHSSMDGNVDDEEEEHNLKIGMQGKAITDLRPNGKGLIYGKRVEIYSQGEFIEAQDSIEIITFEHNKIIVKKLTK